MTKYDNLNLLNQSKNLTEETFIVRLQNGYVLYVKYEYESNGQKYQLEYNLCRFRRNEGDIYLLTIQAGDPNYVWEPPDQRDEKYEFDSPQEAIKFLKEKECFNISDWGYRKGIFMKHKNPKLKK